MFSIFKKKNVEPIDERREAIKQSRQSNVSEPIDDRREAIEQSREKKKPVKKATSKKKK